MSGGIIPRPNPPGAFYPPKTPPHLTDCRRPFPPPRAAADGRRMLRAGPARLRRRDPRNLSGVLCAALPARMRRRRRAQPAGNVASRPSPPLAADRAAAKRGRGEVHGGMDGAGLGATHGAKRRPERAGMRRTLLATARGARRWGRANGGRNKWTEP